MSMAIWIFLYLWSVQNPKGWYGLYWRNGSWMSCFCKGAWLCSGCESYPSWLPLASDDPTCQRIDIRHPMNSITTCIINFFEFFEVFAEFDEHAMRPVMEEEVFNHVTPLRFLFDELDPSGFWLLRRVVLGFKVFFYDWDGFRLLRWVWFVEFPVSNRVLG